MKFAILPLLATILALTKAGPVSQRDSLPDGYTEGPVRWTGEVVPGQGMVTLEGCVQSLRDQILEMNPDYFEQDRSSLTKRTRGQCAPHAISKDVLCNVPYGTVHGKDISKGLTYLSGLDGCFSVSANTCGRISCSYNSGIFVCAGNEDIVYPPKLAADIGGDMFGQCAQFKDGKDFTAQAFTDEGWNVLMKRQGC